MSHTETQSSPPDLEIRISRRDAGIFVIELKDAVIFQLKTQSADDLAPGLADATKLRISGAARRLIELLNQAEEEADRAALRELSKTAIRSEDLGQLREELSRSMPTDEPAWDDDDA